MNRKALLLLLLASLALAQTAEAPVAITAEPSHHLYLKNDRVRVFKVEAAPHAATLIHQHDFDYAFVGLGTSDLRNEVAGRAPAALKLEDGEVRWSKGGFAHRIVNLSGRPFRNVTIEILPRPAGSAQAALEPVSFSAGTAATLVLDNEEVRAFDITLEPGAALPERRPTGPVLLVAVTAVQLRTVTQEVVEAGQQPGDVQWLPAGLAYAVTNTGTARARFIEFEFK